MAKGCQGCRRRRCLFLSSVQYRNLHLRKVSAMRLASPGLGAGGHAVACRCLSLLVVLNSAGLGPHGHATGNGTRAKGFSCHLVSAASVVSPHRPELRLAFALTRLATVRGVSCTPHASVLQGGVLDRSTTSPFSAGTTKIPITNICCRVTLRRSSDGTMN